MATVVYKPQGHSIGFALGQGMSQGLLKEFDRQERQERMQKVKEGFEGIRKAAETGGRKAAMEAANIALGMAEDPADVNTILGYVDQVAPPDNFQQVPIVDTATNQPSLAFVPSRRLGELNTAEGRAGFLPPGARIGTPEETFEYVTPPTEEGAMPGFARVPKSKAPEGAVPLPAFQIGRQLAADKRAEARDTRAEAREDRQEEESRRRFELQMRSEERRDRAAARQAAAAERSARNTEADNFRADANRGISSLRALSSKQMEDGSWQFIGDNEKKLYAQRVPFFEKRLEEAYKKSKGGAINVGKILEETIAKYPGSESREEEPVAPPPSGKKDDEGKPGFLSRMNERARSINQALGITDVPRLSGTEAEVQAAYDKLAPGTTFIGPDGRRYKKPGGK